MHKDEINIILKGVGINPTPVRTLVYKCLESSKTPLSLTDLETQLDSVDKSSISRTLNIFRQNHLVHSFNDGSGSLKYEICHNESSDFHEDLHVHFRCEKCGVTQCLSDIKVPQVDLPEGYEALELSYMISGICPNCSKTQT